jgi:hypothetical protein
MFLGFMARISMGGVKWDPIRTHNLSVLKASYLAITRNDVDHVCVAVIYVAQRCLDICSNPFLHMYSDFSD